MLVLLRTLADIALWRRTPRDLPASTAALAATAALYVLTHAVAYRMRHAGGPALAFGLAELALTAACFGSVLSLRHAGHRLAQTLIAVLGTSLILAPLALAVLALHARTGSAGPAAVLLSIAWLVLLVWNLLILGHITRAALGSSLAAGMAIAITYSLLSMALAGLFVPGAATGGV